ncbi:MAG: twin-arginine translocation signal domain-containing protein [Methylobacteriaceae bacterium]|nr:twin-arginine translocation signal domain-containing protein [Methylobacteriaceae bacterium]
MERRSFLKGLFGFAVVAAACGAKPPAAEAAPTPARPTPPVQPASAVEAAVATDKDIEAAKVDDVYWVVRRRYYRPRRVYYYRPRRVYYVRPRRRRVYYRRYW